ncbi:MAG: YjbH domain-containing protein [Verrucomicrobia bacterium]|nr:YjbH domain-containing protein [Verrucomicrobiota bacterium]MDE3047510.1 YjbH domain-containing protein [Verrucomicrobiota bacterium]
MVRVRGCWQFKGSSILAYLGGSLLRFVSLFCPLVLAAQDSCYLDDPPACRLFKDLERVAQIDKDLKERLPLVINDQLQGGYFTMPSARSFEAGVLGFGFAYVPPYHIWSLGFQFFDHLEATGNYWIFHNQPDERLGHLGFGDSAERAANLKFILLRKEDGISFLPDLAIGWNDFMGTCRFESFYVAATQEFSRWNMEATLGWGNGRIQGLYGGVAWTPFRRLPCFLKDLTLAAEYDANDYKRHIHEHPRGRTVKSRINAGLQFTVWDLIRLSGNTLRGEELAGSIALNYNLGSSKGFIPKTHDPAPYCAPIDTQPIGLLRSQAELAQELAYAFQEQGFDLYDLYLVPEACGQDRLWMKLVNVRYREERVVRDRIQYVLAALAPSNLSTATVVTEADGVPVQEYRFRLEDLRRYAKGCMSENELLVIAPPQEASWTPNRYEAASLFHRRKAIWLLTFRPWFRSFLGSSRGKFKYEVGLALNPEGYLWDEIYYNFCGTYTIKSSTENIEAQDFLNPSRLINVRTDSILYNQSNSWHIDQAFVQKSWNMGLGWFSRIALGYFEMAYAGLALEALYYPVNVNWAIGFQTATLLKRNYYGLGLQHKVRKLTDHGPIFVPYTGFQYFVDFYYQYRPLSLDFKISAGQFLARDKGIRIEGGRTFQSGLRVGLWYTLTNAEDRVNGQRYYDKGFSITMPLDLFLAKSSRTRIGYSMAAWLRDCGAIGATGKQLYPTLFWERYNYKPVFY